MDDRSSSVSVVICDHNGLVAASLCSTLQVEGGIEMEYVVETRKVLIFGLEAGFGECHRSALHPGLLI